jgi:CRISPR-associated protein Cmr6
MTTSKKNIGLYFYRGYYEDYFGKNGIKKKSKEEQLKIANSRNKLFEKFTDLSLAKIFYQPGSTPIKLETSYPGLYTGSGYTFGAGLQGEFQTGFLFDHTSGLPYLPGSTIKGAIRSIFPTTQDEKDERSNFIRDEYLEKMDSDCFTNKFKENVGNKENIIEKIELEIFEGRDFKKEEEKKIKDEFFSIYGRDLFYDAYIEVPVKKGETKGRFLGTDYITPHKRPLENPIPLPFLKILPGVTISFQFQLHDGYYLTAKGKRELFKRILLDFGIGAKTNVGYGQFKA